MQGTRGVQKGASTRGSRANASGSDVPPMIKKLLDLVVAKPRYQGKIIPTVGWVDLLNTHSEGEAIDKKQLDGGLKDVNLSVVPLDNACKSNAKFESNSPKQ